MSEWKEYKLGDLGTVITGKTPSAHNPEDWVKIGKSSRPVDDAKKRHFSLYSAKVFVHLHQTNF